MKYEMERYMAIPAQKIVHHPGKPGKLCLAMLLGIAMLGCGHSKDQKVTELPYYNSADFTPLWQNERHFLPDTIHRIESFNFMDQAGTEVTNKSLEGKIYVSNFFFTECIGICPKMTNNMKLVADSFKNNPAVIFLSHSVTPLKDSVPALKRYAGLNNIDQRQWHLLTGKESEILNIARRSYFIEKLPGLSRDSTEFLHTENMVLVDRKRHIRGLYKGTLELDAMRLVEDINLLLKER